MTSQISLIRNKTLAWAAVFALVLSTIPYSSADHDDDETYDWVALVNGMSTSNGGSILIDDENICKAKEFAESTFDLNPCHTGSAGLAALINKQTNQTSDEIEHGPVNLIILSGLDRS